MRLSAKLAALGMTMATVSGSGMFALTSDDAETEQNNVQTGTYASAVHDIGVARVAQSASCPTTIGSYDADDVIPAEFTGNTIAMPNGTIAQGTAFCIRNHTANAVDLQVGVIGVDSISTPQRLSKEVGTCEASESAVGDSSCLDGEAGEIVSAALRYDVNVMSGSTTGCFSVSDAALNQSTSVADVPIAFNIGSGGICKIWLSLELMPNLTEDYRQRIQTDSFFFKYVFRGSDAGPT